MDDLKQTLLYHGSRTTGLKLLKPTQSALFSDKVVFATPDIRFALAMIHSCGQELSVGYFGKIKSKEKAMYIDELEPNKLKLLNQPGYLYEVNAATFGGEEKNLCHAERISRKPVKVLRTIYIDNVLSELKKYDINIVGYEDVLESLKQRQRDPLIKHAKNRFD